MSTDEELLKNLSLLVATQKARKQKKLERERQQKEKEKAKKDEEERQKEKERQRIQEEEERKRQEEEERKKEEEKKKEEEEIALQVLQRQFQQEVPENEIESSSSAHDDDINDEDYTGTTTNSKRKRKKAVPKRKATRTKLKESLPTRGRKRAAPKRKAVSKKKQSSKKSTSTTTPTEPSSTDIDANIARVKELKLQQRRAQRREKEALRRQQVKENKKVEEVKVEEVKEKDIETPLFQEVRKQILAEVEEYDKKEEEKRIARLNQIKSLVPVRRILHFKVGSRVPLVSADSTMRYTSRSPQLFTIEDSNYLVALSLGDGELLCESNSKMVLKRIRVTETGKELSIPQSPKTTTSPSSSPLAKKRRSVSFREEKEEEDCKKEEDSSLTSWQKGLDNDVIFLPGMMNWNEGSIQKEWKPDPKMNQKEYFALKYNYLIQQGDRFLIKVPFTSDLAHDLFLHIGRIYLLLYELHSPCTCQVETVIWKNDDKKTTTIQHSFVKNDPRRRACMSCLRPIDQRDNICGIGSLLHAMKCIGQDGKEYVILQISCVLRLSPKPPKIDLLKESIRSSPNDLFRIRSHFVEGFYKSYTDSQAEVIAKDVIDSVKSHIITTYSKKGISIQALDLIMDQLTRRHIPLDNSWHPIDRLHDIADTVVRSAPPPTKRPRLITNEPSF